ncbi:hypothetical protein BgAZ_304130 [Babesia gibsoni]|uniref:Uncharacterized protein n=1 Tax=Babesia gibsoni TaxID=33632 RepID=A0AAD8LHR2_BABGI|nr:hypothetical protein BgAZ_304130 [Babesia gibsoni]
MKGFLLTLFSLIAACFAGCVPPHDYPKEIPQPQTVAGQLEFLQEFSELFFSDKKGYCVKLEHHFFYRQVEELYATFCDDLEVLLKDAVELKALLMKPHSVASQRIPEGQQPDRLLQMSVIVAFIHTMHDDLVHLLQELDMHSLNELNITDEEVVAIIERYGFTGEQLADVCVNDVKENLQAFLAEGKPLDKIIKVHSVGLTLRSPDTIGEQFLWLHEFALAVAKNAALEAALLEQLNDVPNGKEVVEAVKELGADDGVLHKVVVDKCCGDAFTCERAIRYTAFDEGLAGRYLELFKQLLGTLRHDVLHALHHNIQHCPAAGNEHFPHELLDGNFHVVEVPCQAGQFLAVDGPLGQLEAFLNEEAQ